MAEELSCSSLGCRNQAKVFALMVASDGASSEVSLCNEHVGDLGPEYVLPNPEYVDAQLLGRSYEACELKTLLFEHESQKYTLVLRSTQSRSVFIFPTGYVEACWIRFIARKTSYPGPPTHALIATIIGALDGALVEAVINGYDTDSHGYKCHLALQTADRQLKKIECRASDAVAIGLVCGFPIKIDNEFLGVPYTSTT